MSTELLRLIRHKRRLWSKHKKYNNAESLSQCKTVEKQVSNKIKKAKRDLERKIASDSSNQKPFFSYIRSKTKSRSGVGPLKANGNIASEDKEMAEILNNYFGGVFQQVDPAQQPPLPPRKPGTRCKLPRFLPSKIKKIIRGLKPGSAPGPDGISPRLLQGMVDQLAGPLSHLFTKSLREKTVPADWKKANVTPIF